MCGCTRHFIIYKTECTLIRWMSVNCFVIIYINGATWRDRKKPTSNSQSQTLMCMKRVRNLHYAFLKLEKTQNLFISRIRWFILSYGTKANNMLYLCFVYFQLHLQMKHTTQIISFARVTAVRKKSVFFAVQGVFLVYSSNSFIILF